MKTHCPQGHDISVVGRNANGQCTECQRIRNREYKERNKEKIRENGRLDRELYRQTFGKTQGNNL
jgi:hypothetical protein